MGDKFFLDPALHEIDGTARLDHDAHLARLRLAETILIEVVHDQLDKVATVSIALS